MTHNGWDQSATAWLQTIGEAGDFGRVAVLDPVMRGLAARFSGRAIDIANWHRPFAFYFQRLLGLGLILRHSDEPMTQGPHAGTKPKFNRMPNFVVMLWEKPA